MSISSHKIFGPQGVGALLVRRFTRKNRPLAPIAFGGGQERGLRPGTIPVPLVVGFGEAAKLALDCFKIRREIAIENRKIAMNSLDLVKHFLNGDQKRCQPHVLNVRFPGVDSEALMMTLKEKLAFSNGSACTSADYNLSHVLKAMGLNDDECSESIRLSWASRDLSNFCKTLVATVKSIASPF